MKKRRSAAGRVLILGGAVILMLNLLSGCSGGRSATVRITSHRENTMVYIPDGERPAPAEPVWETFTVRRGDKVFNECVEIRRVTGDDVTVELFFEFCGRLLDEDGRYKKNLKDGKVFTIPYGCTAELNMLGICDESYTICIAAERSAGTDR